MPVREQSNRPENWTEYRSRVRSSWLVPLLALEWGWEWIAWALGNWAFVEVLERLGSFSVLAAVIFYFLGTGTRIRQAHYQAWQVINTAQGKGGSGGRIEALEQLNRGGVSLIGVDVSGAFLRGIRLDNARLSRSNLASADVRQSSFHRADLDNSTMTSANFRNSDFDSANLRDSDLTNADFSGAILSYTDLTGVDLSDADLRYADLRGARLDWVRGAKLANIYGLRNASPAVLKRLITAGAVTIQSDEEWTALENKR